VKDLCEALQVEYTEKLGDAPSRGAKSVVAKAADRMDHSDLFLIVAKQSQRVEVKKSNVHVVEDSPSKDFVIQTEGANRNALTA
jgi:prolyl-tRNA editing enzyme YbaK/EbsC (Cys-tRNA(Pro) deacylase)